MIKTEEQNTYPVYLNVVSLGGRKLIKAWMTETEIIQYVEKLFNEDAVYLTDDTKHPAQLLDIAINSGSEIHSLIFTYTDTEDKQQFEDTLEILLDNSQE